MDSGSIQHIAAAVTPAVMVSARGLLALGLDNQAGRMAIRMRDMLRERRGLTAAETTRREILRRQVVILARRHALLAWALRLIYASIFAFVLTSLCSLAHGVVSVPPAVPFATFAGGVLLLGAVALFALGSIHLLHAAILLEMGAIE